MQFIAFNHRCRGARGILPKTLRIMQVTTAMLLGLCLQAAATGFAQTITFSGKDVPMEKVFTVIKQQTGYFVSYKSGQLSKAKPVTVQGENMPLKQFLNEVFRNQQLDYSIEENTIFIKWKKEIYQITPLESISGTLSPPADINLSGRVTNEQQEPLEGVSVTVKAAQNGTTTNADGRFLLSVPSANNVELVFSFVGFETHTVKVGTQTVFNIVLKAFVAGMEDVVVTALGITKEKRKIGYSLTEVYGEDLLKSRSNNLVNSLSGRVPGLNVSSSATGVGSSSRLVLRGNTSLSGENQPLYVIDGIPIDNSNRSWAGMYGGRDGGDGIQMINPDDVESISILKGGAAAALYGSRSATGVILITTKKGSKMNGFGIEINSNLVVEKVNDFTDWQYEYGHGIMGNAPSSAQEANGISPNSWGSRLDGSMVFQWDGVLRPYIAHKNNISKFYKTGTNINNSVSIYGSGDKFNYNFNMTDLQNRSVVPNSNLQRNNFSLNIGVTPLEKLTLNIIGKYVRERTKNRPRVSDSPGNANYSITTIPTSWEESTYWDKMVDSITKGERKFNSVPYVTNPYWATYRFDQSDGRDRFIGAIQGKYSFNHWLYSRARISTDTYTRNNLDITPMGTQYSSGGQINIQSVEKFREFNSEVIFGARVNSNKLEIDAFTGGNIMKSFTDGQFLAGNNFYAPNYYYINNLRDKWMDYSYRKVQTNSLFASVDLTYDRFLALNLTGRNDWFSTLSPNNWSNFYPSASLGFIFSEVINLPSFINYSKIRSSWAKVSGQRDPYGLNLQYSLSANSYNSLPVGGISGTTIPNKNLKPFTVETVEIGMENRFFSNKVNLDLTFYTKKTKNDIVISQISQTSGFNSVLINAGTITNKGVELQIGATPLNRMLRWTLTYNFSYNDSRVTKISDQLNSIQIDQARSMTAFIANIEGTPYGQIQGYGFKTNEEGKLLLNDGGFPQRGELKTYGTGVAPLLMGLTNSISYKGFVFEFLIDSRFGGYLYSGTNDGSTLRGLTKQTLYGREDGVIVDGIIESSGQKNNLKLNAQRYWQSIAMNISEPFIFKSDFIKLRELTLGYTLPSKLILRSPFKSINISLVGRNLAVLLKKVPNIDPESSYNNSNAQGLEWFGVPSVRSMGLNLNFKF
ncbi:SusC/RagA family TonB-linked outer membrane protein [Agriterribacter sp.]|uniref:SusC/RagA family TonB-linked outer membrane protein n=1 Tax=Agriterribacter sp. TaxID=2821509 RepID=UPI002BE709B9|nr:SusC/RagA family TonB-linked outer membrane protein [Agriterribacter sp.]HRO47118.1 SusC/RagA family TonB-linked outer membrane protein [Agriterribacter sp.]HRQ17875.1 SusC/RagA family TonB-linked outer membrane protein [Agriterribacter sp.]